MRKRVGFFGGTFDPLHFGHINLCLSLMEALLLDEVIVCPCGTPVMGKQPVASPLQRFEMTKLFFEDIPHIHVIDAEIRRESSYTVDTLKALKKERGDAELFLMLGVDTIQNFPQWKNPEEIMQLSTSAIGRRSGVVMPSFQEPFKSYFEKKDLKVPIFEISSTEVRKRLRQKQLCAHLVPAKVLDYIYQNGLYS